MMKNLIFSLIIILLTGFFSCSEEEEPTKKDLLSQDWQTEKIDKNDTDVSGNYNFSFSQDNTFSFATSDNNLANIPNSGQWEFNSNETKILLNGTIELVIITLTSEELIFEYSYDNYKDGTVTYRFVLKMSP